jgi:hypothetical protein
MDHSAVSGVRMDMESIGSHRTTISSGSRTSIEKVRPSRYPRPWDMADIPHAHRPYRVFLPTPILFASTALFLIVLSCFSKPLESLAAFGEHMGPGSSSRSSDLKVAQCSALLEQFHITCKREQQVRSEVPEAARR